MLQTVGKTTGENEIQKREEEICTTTDVLIIGGFCGRDIDVTAMVHHDVQARQVLHAHVIAGTITGVIEINEQELLGSMAEDVLMGTTGVDDVIVMDRQFVADHELAL